MRRSTIVARSVVAVLLVAALAPQVASAADTPGAPRPHVVIRVEPSAGTSVAMEQLARRNAVESARYLINLRVRVENISANTIRMKRFSFETDVQGGFGISSEDIEIASGSHVSRTFWRTIESSTRPTMLTGRFVFEGLDEQRRTWPLVVHRNQTRSGAYRFPGRASDLPSGTFWWHGRTQTDESHHHDTITQQFAYDLSNTRWDGKAWTNLKPGVTTPTRNEDFLIWNRPVYAMADGVVLECRRTVADNTKLGSLDGGGGGNGFFIRHGGDEVALYAHLRLGSVPEALCPTETLPGEEMGHRPTVAQPIRVREGQLLGRVGNTGNSSEPHLHLHLQRGYPGSDTTPGLPLHFDRFRSRAYLVQDSVFDDPTIWTPGTAPGPHYVGIGELGAIPSFGLVTPNPCGWQPPAGGRLAMVRHHVPRTCFHELVDELVAGGYLPSAINGYDVGGQTYFNIVARPNTGVPVTFFPSLGRAKLQSVFDKQTSAGYRLAHVDSYLRFGEPRYAAVFRREAGPPFLVYADMSKALFSERGGRLHSVGYRPKVLSVIEDQGEPRFTALYEHKDVGAFVVRAGLDEGALGDAIATYRAKGLEPVHLDGYNEAGKTRFATIWTSAATDAVIAAGFSPTTFRVVNNGQASQGRATEVVTGYQSGGKPRLAGIWRAPG